MKIRLCARVPKAINVRSIRLFAFVVTTVLCFAANRASAALIDSWRAADLESAFTNGAPVSSWLSQLGRVMTNADPELRPRFVHNVTPTGSSAVHFDLDQSGRC